MQNIYLEGQEIFDHAEEYEFLEAKTGSVIKEIFRAYKTKVGRIGKYNYNKKDLEELLNSEPELLQSIEEKLESAKNRQKALNEIVEQIVKIIAEDNADLETAQSAMPASQARIASVEFTDKEKFTEMIKKIFRGIKYINHVAKQTKEITPINMSNISQINDQLLEDIFEKLNLIENTEVNEIRQYMQSNDLVGNNKIVWPTIKIQFPEALNQDFIDKYYKAIMGKATGEKGKELKRLNRKTERMNNKANKAIAKTVGEDIEYAIKDLKTNRHDDSDENINAAIKDILRSHSKADVKTYLSKKSEKSRYNFEGSNVKDALYELFATESRITRRGRQRKS